MNKKIILSVAFGICLGAGIMVFAWTSFWTGYNLYTQQQQDHLALQRLIIMLNQQSMQKEEKKR